MPGRGRGGAPGVELWGLLLPLGRLRAAGGQNRLGGEGASGRGLVGILLLLLIIISVINLLLGRESVLVLELSGRELVGWLVG